jgi:hypothetical protein
MGALTNMVKTPFTVPANHPKNISSKFVSHISTKGALKNHVSKSIKNQGTFVTK